MHDLPSKDWINNEGKFTPTNHQRETMHDPYVACRSGQNDSGMVCNCHA
ncbi:MAG: hypothetical protein IPO04_15685 [Cytophagaceae bacterium]|nr:hypothetical protein [Cytophagaceae bacterium]